jgi:hypothetical protein
MSKFRVAALGVLAVLVLASAYYWMSVARQPAAEPARSTLQVEVTMDGAISVDGEPFTDSEKLKKLFAVLRRQVPFTDIVAFTPKNISPESMGKAAKLLRDSGERNISFETRKDAAPD